MIVGGYQGFFIFHTDAESIPYDAEQVGGMRANFRGVCEKVGGMRANFRGVCEKVREISNNI